MAARKANGEIPADIPLGGFGDLLLMDGNYDNKHTFVFHIVMDHLEQT